MREAILDQAIDWHARQASGAFSGEDQHGFDAWLNAAPEHSEAWAHLQRRLQHALAPLANTPARQALQVPSQQRRALLRGALCLGGVALSARLLSEPGLPLAGLRADLSTGTGERRRFALPDGASLLLNAESAVDLDFAQGRHQVRLLDGGLLAELPSAPQAALELSCRYGSAQLACGRGILTLLEQQAEFWLLAGQATLTGRSGERLTLSPGQGARLSASGLQPSTPEGDPQAWTQGLLEVHHQTLAQVVAALRPYHRGPLRVAPAVANLRISGLFYLDDSERALAALSEVLPIRIERYLGWWTRLEAA
ncbi:MAG: Protein FecR [Pseudomonas citronellolis]|nr:MAG: Protein FecR [Pseudomonas citronellolis]